MRMQVEQVMSRPVETCRPEDSASKAAEVMWNRDIGFLAVVDGDGKAIAAITDRDLCMASYTQGRPLAEIPVHSAMSAGLSYVRANAPLDVVEELMQSRQVRRLPVLDEDDRPVGVVTLGDLARASRQRGGPKADEITQTIVMIEEPRSSSIAVAAA